MRLGCYPTSEGLAPCTGGCSVKCCGGFEYGAFNDGVRFPGGKDWNTEGGHKHVTTEYSVDTVGRGLLVTVLREGVMCPWVGPDKVGTSWSGLSSDKCLREAVLDAP